MTAKEKAKELIEQYIRILRERTDVFNAYSDLSFAKECALIAVEELIKEADPNVFVVGRHHKDNKEYWQLVKYEIDNA